jgi:hypothetical protein
MRTSTSGAARTLSIVLLVTLAAVVAACGAGSSAALAPVGGEGDGVIPGAAPSAAPGRLNGQDGGVTTDAFRDEARIVRTGSLQLEVDDVTDALASARATVIAMGGYIGASQQYNDGEGITASVTYRIPAERWEDALDAFRALGTPVAEQTDAAEVTDQIVDLDARIRNLRASETALVRHASEAVRVADLLEIEARLSDVRGQIEQLTAQQRNLEDRAAYATLTVTFGTEILAVQQTAEKWDPQAEVDRAGASLLGFIQALTTAGIWFAIVWLPILVVLAAIVVVVVFVARRFGLLRRQTPIPPAAA